MEIKAIRKLPTLAENQEWACEQGCEVIRPILFENVYNEVRAHDGSFIRRESEHYYTCQNKHLLCVWDNGANDYVVLSVEYYEAEQPKIVETNNIQDSIDLLSSQMDEQKEAIITENCFTSDGEEELEQLIGTAIMYGQYIERNDADVSAKWVESAKQKPELVQKHASSISQSKAILFHVRDGGTYHGYYIERPENINGELILQDFYITSTFADEEVRVFSAESVQCWANVPELGVDDALVPSFGSVNPVLGMGDWVKTYDAMPQLHEPKEDGRNYSSKELFFTIRNEIYHGWYI